MHFWISSWQQGSANTLNSEKSTELLPELISGSRPKRESSCSPILVFLLDFWLLFGELSSDKGRFPESLFALSFCLFSRFYVKVKRISPTIRSNIKYLHRRRRQGCRGGDRPPICKIWYRRVKNSGNPKYFSGSV